MDTLYKEFFNSSSKPKFGKPFGRRVYYKEGQSKVSVRLECG